MTRKRSALLFALVLVLRLSIAGEFRGNFDSDSYGIVAAATLAGQNIYAATDRYNYSPVWSWIVTGLWSVAAPNRSLFVLLIGLLLIAVDVATAALVFALARHRLGLEEPAALRAALLFFANPVSILISCAHGQFDGFSILFLLVAIWLATGPAAETVRTGVLVAASLAASILVKHITAFHLLLFWRRVRRPGYPLWVIAAPVAVFFLSFVPYLSAWPRILSEVFFYGLRSGSTWQQHGGGWGALFPIAPYGSAVMAVVFLGSVGFVLRATRTVELPRAALVLFLSNLVFLPSSAVQYSVWPIALGSLYAGAPYGVFTGAVALYHSAAAESLHIRWPVRSTPLGIWFCALVWLVVELLRIRSRCPGPGTVVVELAQATSDSRVAPA
jgi:hypothetical protein